jgi:DNA-directed RNA polymerase alpha subunit
MINILNQPIERPDFTARTYNVLYMYEIDTVGDLAAKRERDLRKLRNCGRKTINEIRCFLKDRGLDLMDPDPRPESIMELRAKVAFLEARNRELQAELDRLREW